MSENTKTVKAALDIDDAEYQRGLNKTRERLQKMADLAARKEPKS